jgi:hypothetical protein
MSTTYKASVKHASQTHPAPVSGTLRRKCACGTHTGGGACAECSKKKRDKKPLQTRLAIGKSNDVFEQEADSVAEQIMRMPEARTFAAGNQQQSTHNRPHIQRRTQITHGTESSEAPPIVHDVLRSSGRPLDRATLNFMQPRFGYDFSQVRLHTDARAAQSASAVNAQAYTVGNNIVLGSGLSSREGFSRQHVLAHELAHVIQQNSATPDGSYAAGSENTAHAAVAGNQRLSAKRIEGQLQRLGTNPGCSTAQARDIHQSIFNANSWVRKALTALAATPLAARTLRALRNNFGASGTAANAATIATRLRAGQTDMTSIPISCTNATNDAFCANGNCGDSVSGGHASNICTNVTLATNDAVFRAGCVLHEAMHASDASMTADSYSGWFGHSGSTGGYPGATPLTNADSYTTLAMELS